MKPKVSKGSQLSGRKWGLGKAREAAPVFDLDWRWVLRRLFAGVRRLSVALKYQWMVWFPNSRGIPWIKIGVLAFIAFLLLKRDLQFQVNIRSPFGEGSETGARDTKQSHFATTASLQQSLDWHQEASAPVDPFEDQATDSDKDKKVKAYIRRYRDVAQAEMEKFGIPASIKMAQGILESESGSSRLATKNNNHFGIKCFSKSCAKGHCSNFSDDHHKDFFRAYKSAWESWRAHSQLLTQDRYKSLLKLGNDYKAWAKGLKKLGYATDPNYEQKLVEKIETYQLYLLDKD